MGVFDIRKKMEETRQMNWHIKRLAVQIARLASANNMLADSQAMLDEVTAKYTAEKLSAISAINAIRTEISTLDASVQSNPIYTAEEKLEYENKRIAAGA